MKVLVVDDSRMFRVRLVNLLSTIEGVEDIAEAENGRKAMKLYQEDKPQLLILDIRMRNDNGIEFLKEIKKEPDAPKVIMLTNFPYPQYRRICMEEGADFFLDKSTEFDEITEIIRELVDQH
jgi:DNA-binding NarL/FixJ family response regulator